MNNKIASLLQLVFIGHHLQSNVFQWQRSVLVVEWLTWCWLAAEAGSWRWAVSAGHGPAWSVCDAVVAAVSVNVCEYVSAGWGSEAAGTAAAAAGVGRRLSPWAEETSPPFGLEECTGGTWASLLLASHLWASYVGSCPTSWTVQKREAKLVGWYVKKKMTTRFKDS